jgi:2-oxoisovalerate dehydrogenase E2 component (dihydrolipoyl transacylase)
MASVKQFNLPDLGEGLTEGEIIKWLVAVGDTIELNQPIVEVETAKAAVEIPAKWAGRVEAIFHAEGETVDVGTPIIAIETDPAAPVSPSGDGDGGGGAAPAEETTVLVGYGPRAGSVKRRPRRSDPPAAAAPAPTTAPVAPAPRPAPEPTVAPTPSGPELGASAQVLAKPPVRKLARDLGVDLQTITGSGPQGSITREDVQAAVGQAEAPAAALPAAAPSFGSDREQRIPIRGVRKLTAENMVASAFTAPHVTEFLTVDVTRSMRVLDRLRDQPEWRDVRISPLLLVAKAALLAIGRHPLVNSTWSEATGEIVVKEYVNLGIAAATERGLIVPNISDAGRLSLRGLADALTALVQTAKTGKTPPAEMSGGTFTITNVGVFGVDAGTPILPPGEAAILAFGAVREAPWVHRGKVKVRQVTTLSLSFDHRIIDGELGSHFLRDVGRFLTDPETMLLSWC